MSATIEIDPSIQIRVLQHKLDSARSESDAAVTRYMQVLSRCNRLSADRERLRQANTTLLQQLAAQAGYPERLLLGLA
jgi:hypothetical protein